MQSLSKRLWLLGCCSLAAQRSQAALTAAQLLAPSLRQVRVSMLPSLPRVSQPSTLRTPQQHVTTHKWPPQYRRQPPGTGRQRLSRSLCAGKAARGQFGRPALFGLRFTALHCASDGSRARATHFFRCLKRSAIGKLPNRAGKPSSTLPGLLPAAHHLGTRIPSL